MIKANTRASSPEPAWLTGDAQLLTFQPNKPIWEETSMQEEKKERDLGLERETEKVCGPRESQEGCSSQERSSPMGRATASHQASGHMPWPQKGLPWGGLPEETGLGSLGLQGWSLTPQYNVPSLDSK